MEPMDHPSVKALEDFDRGKLTDEVAESIVKHLELCPQCFDFVERLPPSSLALELHKAADSPDDFPTRSSRSLLGRIQQGQKDAWKRFAALCLPLIYQWALGQKLASADAQRFAQEAFLRLIDQLSEYFSASRPSFRDWLQSLVLEAWRCRMPEKAQMSPNDEPHPMGGSDVFAEPQYQQKVTAHWLEIARKDFTPSTWSAFEQSALKARSLREVALSLGMTPIAVVVARHEVLSRLRQELEDLL